MNAWLPGHVLWAVKSCVEQVALGRAGKSEQVGAGRQAGKPSLLVTDGIVRYGLHECQFQTSGLKQPIVETEHMYTQQSEAASTPVSSLDRPPAAFCPALSGDVMLGWVSLDGGVRPGLPGSSGNTESCPQCLSL